MDMKFQYQACTYNYNKLVTINGEKLKVIYNL